MKIEEISVKNFFGNDNSNKKWEIKQMLYLYGQNGIGKTTILDAIFVAITGSNDILRLNTRQGQIIRGLEFSELVIKMNNNKNITLVGKYNKNTNFYKKAKELLKESININTNNSYKLLGDIYDKLNHHVFLSETAGTVESYIKNYHKKPIINTKEIEFRRLIEQLNSCVANIINQTNISSRQEYISNFDVLFLTIERMKPKTIRIDNSFYENPAKANLTKSIYEIIQKFNSEINIFKNKVQSFLSEAVIYLMKNTLENKKEKILEDYKLENNKDLIILVLKNVGFDESTINIMFKKYSTNNIVNIFLNKVLKFGEDKLFILMKKINDFISNINDYFLDNSKKIWFDSKELSVFIEDKNHSNPIKIEEYNFSSGEKQIITILFNLSFHEKENLLILIDEPELSLSIDWQEKLYKTISKFKNSQIIAVTHSPFSVPEENYKDSLKEF
ncbi:MAG: AAA family ATPase [Mycoplasma sp.]|nr:AAA family ATPase [Mycoplasma sp.]